MSAVYCYFVKSLLKRGKQSSFKKDLGSLKDHSARIGEDELEEYERHLVKILSRRDVLFYFCPFLP